MQCIELLMVNLLVINLMVVYNNFKKMTKELAENISIVLNYEILRIDENPLYNIGGIFKAVREKHDDYISTLHKIIKIKNGNETELNDNDFINILNSYSSTTKRLYNLEINENISDIKVAIQKQLSIFNSYWMQIENIRFHNSI